MKRTLFAFLFLGMNVFAQQTNVAPMLDMDSVEKPAKTETRVTRVYGTSATDYLSATDIETARRHLRPNIRGPRSRPAFDLPDAFYFIGGPIFLLLFLRVLVIFFNDFEEKRKEEQRAAAIEKPQS